MTVHVPNNNIQPFGLIISANVDSNSLFLYIMKSLHDLYKKRLAIYIKGVVTLVSMFSIHQSYKVSWKLSKFLVREDALMWNKENNLCLWGIFRFCTWSVL